MVKRTIVNNSVNGERYLQVLQINKTKLLKRNLCPKCEAYSPTLSKELGLKMYLCKECGHKFK